MSRDRTRSRGRSGDAADATGEFEFDVGEESDPAPRQPREERQRSDDDDGLRDRVGRRAKRIFSPRAFAAALLVSVAGLFAANAFVPLPGSGLLGVFLGTFLLGLAVAERRYAETAAAGGVAVGASVFLDFAVVAVLGGFGLPLAVLGGVAGAAAGALGTYFGRDLRDGLTREVET